MPRPCLNHGCSNEVDDGDPKEFCVPCETLVLVDANNGLTAFVRYLGLEAEFVVWCAEHGQPNPHE